MQDDAMNFEENMRQFLASQVCQSNVAMTIALLLLFFLYEFDVERKQIRIY